MLKVKAPVPGQDPVYITVDDQRAQRDEEARLEAEAAQMPAGSSSSSQLATPQPSSVPGIKSGHALHRDMSTVAGLPSFSMPNTNFVPQTQTPNKAAPGGGSVAAASAVNAAFPSLRSPLSPSAPASASTSASNSAASSFIPPSSVPSSAVGSVASQSSLGDPKSSDSSGAATPSVCPDGSPSSSPPEPSSVPVPGQGSGPIGANPTATFEFALPATHRPPLTDLDFKTLFGRLEPSNILTIFNCLLCEVPVLVVSAHVELLTPALEAIVALLYPLQWPYIYIPLLPLALTDMLAAPVPFLIGTLSEALNEPPWPDHALVVDLDKNMLHTNNLDRDVDEVKAGQGQQSTTQTMTITTSSSKTRTRDGNVTSTVTSTVSHTTTTTSGGGSSPLGGGFKPLPWRLTWRLFDAITRHLNAFAINHPRALLQYPKHLPHYARPPRPLTAKERSKTVELSALSSFQPVALNDRKTSGHERKTSQVASSPSPAQVAVSPRVGPQPSQGNLRSSAPISVASPRGQSQGSGSGSAQKPPLSPAVPTGAPPAAGSLDASSSLSLQTINALYSGSEPDDSDSAGSGPLRRSARRESVELDSNFSVSEFEERKHDHDPLDLGLGGHPSKDSDGKSRNRRSHSEATSPRNADEAKQSAAAASAAASATANALVSAGGMQNLRERFKQMMEDTEKAAADGHAAAHRRRHSNSFDLSSHVEYEASSHRVIRVTTVTLAGRGRSSSFTSLQTLDAPIAAVDDRRKISGSNAVTAALHAP